MLATSYIPVPVRKSFYRLTAMMKNIRLWYALELHVCKYNLAASFKPIQQIMLDVLICVTGDASPDQKGHVWSGTDRQREHTGFLYGPHAGLYCTANY